jgi:hypothetical protein
MGFFASLLAYVFAVGGIVLAMAMSYAVLLAPSEEPSSPPPHAVAAIVRQASPPASDPPSSRTAQAPNAHHDASHLAQAEATRKNRVTAGRKALAANEARQRRAGSPDGGAYAGLWAFQRPPDRGTWRYGYAEEDANGSDRGW